MTYPFPQSTKVNDNGVDRTVPLFLNPVAGQYIRVGAVDPVTGKITWELAAGGGGGGGSVETVNGEGPDGLGNVQLSAADVGADPAGSAAAVSASPATVATTGSYNDLVDEPATGIPLALLTAAGDLVYASGAGAGTTLGVGSQNAVLAVGASNALQWARNSPMVIATLTDGTTVSTPNAFTARLFKLVAAGNRTIPSPTNPVDGRPLIIAHTASGADRTLSLTTGATGAFAFGTSIPGLTPTTSGTTDYIGTVYDSTSQRWRVISYAKGYTA